MHNLNQMVILEVPGDLPWRYQMRSTIELMFRRNAASEKFQFSMIDAIDECGDTEPGRFLLDRYCTSRETRNGYRSGSKKTIQQYLIEHKVLHDSVIWIKGMDSKQAKTWIKFCRDYNSNAVEDGLFVLEVHDFPETSYTQGFKAIKFDTFVSSYDVQLLNSFILDNRTHYSNIWKKYVSTVAATLCGNDAEISAELLDIMDFKTQNPIDGLKLIEEGGQYSSRGADKGSSHVLAFLRKENYEELSRRIWTAQVQVLFPSIELERIEIINRYFEDIQEVLDREVVTQYDEILSKPRDVEIGTLDYLVKSFKIRMPVESDRQRIHFLHYCRNELAHMGCLPYENVVKLID